MNMIKFALRKPIAIMVLVLGLLFFGFKASKEIKARYVKVIAKKFGILPEWHQGAGGKAFIFIDEITIK